MIYPHTARTAAHVRAHYDELDAPYREIWGDHVHHGYWIDGTETPERAVEALVDLVLARLDLQPGQALCDIGCGYGATAGYIADRRDVAITGFTISHAQALIAGAIHVHRRRLAGERSARRRL